jgi:hypothetical protein
MYTSSDWYEWTEFERVENIIKVVEAYKSAVDWNGFNYSKATEAQEYFVGSNRGVLEYVRKIKELDRESKINVIPSMTKIFNVLVQQKTQFSLVKGIQTDEQANKKLGNKFNDELISLVESAIVQGVSFAFWNFDKMVHYSALHAVPLYSELTGDLEVLIRFWAVYGKDKVFYEVYEPQGVTRYVSQGGLLSLDMPLTSYVRYNQEQISGGAIVPDNSNGKLPIFPLWANPEKISHFTEDIKHNIDRYDRTLTDFGINLDNTNEVMWSISNFGGTEEDAKRMVKTFKEIGVFTSTKSSGGIVNSTDISAEPVTVNVPHEARMQMLDTLKSLIIFNFGGLDVHSIAGNNRTATEVEIATTNLNNNAHRLENELSKFLQKLFDFLGLSESPIGFQRDIKTNASEYNNMIYSGAEFLGHEGVLRNLTFVDTDEIEQYMAFSERELYTVQKQENKESEKIEEVQEVDNG